MVYKLNVCIKIITELKPIFADQQGSGQRLSVVCRMWCASVSTITTRNNKDVKSIFGADVHHVPGLCLLGIGGTPYISHKIMA